MKTTWKFIYGTLFLSVCSLELMAAAHGAGAHRDSEPAAPETTVSRGAGVATFVGEAEGYGIVTIGTNCYRDTALQEAALKGDVAYCKSSIAARDTVLDQHKIAIDSVKVLNNHCSTTVGLVATSAPANGHEVIALLANAGVNVNLYNCRSETPLDLVAAAMHQPMCSALLTAGADPHYVREPHFADRHPERRTVLDYLLFRTGGMEPLEKAESVLVTLLAAGVSPTFTTGAPRRAG